MSGQVVILNSADEAQKYSAKLRDSAVRSHGNLQAVINDKNPMRFLYEIKFNHIGYDPLHSKKSLNLIEQVNQTFTYLASFNAAILLFQWHSELKELKLNLGTMTGTDIESENCGGIAAEVFAAVTPENNQKLKKDKEKVSRIAAAHKYVFFMSPKHKKGEIEKGNITVYSLGAEL